MQSLCMWVIQAEDVQNPIFFHKLHSWRLSSHGDGDTVGRGVGAADIGGVIVGVVVGLGVGVDVVGLVVGSGVGLNDWGIGSTTKVSEMLASRPRHCTWPRRQVYARRSTSVRPVMGTSGSMMV